MNRICIIVGPQKEMIMAISTTGIRLVSSGGKFAPKDGKVNTKQINGRLSHSKSGRVSPYGNILNFDFKDLRQH